jgi:hypothetical protein
MIGQRLPATALFLATCLCFATPGGAREINSYAILNEDATLRIAGQTVRLYCIHIPRTDRTCRTSRTRPSRRSRVPAALAYGAFQATCPRELTRPATPARMLWGKRGPGPAPGNRFTP